MAKTAHSAEVAVASPAIDSELNSSIHKMVQEQVILQQMKAEAAKPVSVPEPVTVVKKVENKSFSGVAHGQDFGMVSADKQPFATMAEELTKTISGNLTKILALFMLIGGGLSSMASARITPLFMSFILAGMTMFAGSLANTLFGAAASFPVH